MKEYPTMLYVEMTEYLFHIEKGFQPLATEIGVTVSELHILHSLYVHSNGVHASELAASVGKAPTSFTPILDKLVAKGFVERRPDPEDRRAVLIFLTPIGEASRDQVIQDIKPIERRLRAEMSNYILMDDVTEITRERELTEWVSA
jgi:DNA-binding MarR family transcriptional regulator